MTTIESLNKNQIRSLIHEFINALQLGIKNEILKWSRKDHHDLRIHFSQKPQSDKGWSYFEKLIHGHWNPSETQYQIKNFEKSITPLLINFLLLTRLQSKNIEKIAQIDARFIPFLEKLGKRPSALDKMIVENLEQASHFIFTHLAKQKKTMRELSQETGLSPMALNSFKRGGDVRLSNLLKITKAIGIKVELIS